MAFTFSKAVDTYKTTLRATHSSGGSTLALATGTGAALGSLGANQIFRVVALSNPDTTAETVLAVLDCTGISTDDLTGVGATTGYTNPLLISGTAIQVRQVAQDDAEIKTAIATNAANIATNTTAITLRALDSAAVHVTGNETIAGTKTFTSTIDGTGLALGTSSPVEVLDVVGNARIGAGPAGGFSQLSGAIGSGDTSILLTSAAGLPPNGTVAIGNNGATSEWVRYAAISGSTLTGVTRGAYATTAASHGDATIVRAVYLVTNKNATSVPAFAAVDGALLASTTQSTSNITDFLQFKFASGANYFGYNLNGWLETSNGSQSSYWTPTGIGSFSANSFNIVAGNGFAATFDANARLGVNRTSSIAAQIHVVCAANIPVATFQAANGQTTPVVSLQGISSTSTARDVGYLDAGFSTATDASYKGYVRLAAQDFNAVSGGREGVRVGTSGTAATLGFYGTTPVVQPTGDIGAALVGLGLLTAVDTQTLGGTSLDKLRLTSSSNTMPWSLTCSASTFTGVVDNVVTEGWTTGNQVAGQPSYTENWESRYVDGAPPNGLIERHGNYRSIDGATSYRPWGHSFDLNTHTWSVLWSKLSLLTIQSPDLSKTLSYDGAAGNLSVPTTVSATSFSGSGASLGSLNATSLASGTVADARFPAVLKVNAANTTLGIGTADNTTAMNDPIGGVTDTFAVATGGGTNLRYGFAQGYSSITDGTRTAIMGVNSTDGFFIGSYSNHKITFRVNNSNKLTLDSSGNIAGQAAISCVNNISTTTGQVLANTGSSLPVALGAPLGDSNPGLWFHPTPSFDNYSVLIAGNSTFLNAPTGGDTHLRVGNTTLIKVSTGAIGFYGATPVAKAATPTTLADVITLLQNLGLCS